MLIRPIYLRTYKSDATLKSDPPTYGRTEGRADMKSEIVIKMKQHFLIKEYGIVQPNINFLDVVIKPVMALYSEWARDMVSFFKVTILRNFH